MTGAVNINPRAVVRSLDDMMKAGQAEGWDALEAMFKPALVGEQFRPDDAVLLFFGALAGTEIGRMALDWLFALTNNAPYPRDVGDRLETAALAAKAHAARAAVGEAILQAVLEGRKLLEQPKQERAT
jgi:hypothetical protein